MNKKLMKLLVGLIFALSTSIAQALSLGYINASGGNVDYLASYGHSVTYLNNPVGLTLGDLAAFDAVMLASNGIFLDPVDIGNVVADFADAGGGVVLTQFDFQGWWALDGRIMTSGYSPFTIDPLSSDYAIPDGLGTIYDPSSDLFNGVVTANVTTDYQANVGLDVGATLIADWSSGRHAIGFNSLMDTSVVGLNLFPATSWSTDTQRLVANAIDYSVQGEVTVPEPSSLLLMGIGLAGLGFVRVRKRS